jgi:hypothetical protein
MNIHNDADILKHTQRTTIDGGVRLLMPGNLMPDGEPFAWAFPGDPAANKLIEWCENVRGEYLAREESKNSAPRSKAPAPTASSGGEDSDVQDDGAGSVAERSDIPDAEAKVEEHLKHAFRILSEGIEREFAAQERASNALKKLTKEKARVERALEAYQIETE